MSLFTQSFVNLYLVTLYNKTNEIDRNAYKILIGKAVGKGQFLKSGCKWKNNMKMYLGGRRWDGVNCTHLVQDMDQRLDPVNTVMNFRVS
jgi:hypothetical protein